MLEAASRQGLTVPELDQYQGRVLGLYTAGLGSIVALMAVRVLAVPEDALELALPLVLLLVSLAGWLSHRPVLLPVTGLTVILLTALGLRLPSSADRLGVIIGLMIATVVLAAFLERGWGVALVGMAVLAALAASPGGARATTVVGAVGVFLVGLVVGWLRQQAIRALRRERALFDDIPVALMVQDWTGAEAELERLRREGVTDLRAHLEEHPELVGQIIARNRLVDLNRAALEMYGVRDRDQFVARFAATRVDARSFDDYLDHLIDMWKGVMSNDQVIATSDVEGNPLWTRTRWFPHPDGGGLRIVGALDVTPLEQARMELEELIRSKDRFVASVSHELRTPLSAVVGFTSELAHPSAPIDEATRQEMLELAWREASEVADIIEDLLVAARADIGGVHTVHDAIDIEAELSTLSAIAGFDLPVSGAEDLPAVCADAGRVRQVLRNLMTNAHRYGGSNRHIRCGVHGGQVYVEVRDDGTDITDEELELVFEPYSRVHRTSGLTESVGLGLTVARHLTAVMGGDLEGFRDSGETVFRLRLPVWGRCPVADAGV